MKPSGLQRHRVHFEDNVSGLVLLDICTIFSHVPGNSNCISAYLIFELEVTTRPLLGDEQQVVEEEEVPLLAL